MVGFHYLGVMYEFLSSLPRLSLDARIGELLWVALLFLCLTARFPRSPPLDPLRSDEEAPQSAGIEDMASHEGGELGSAAPWNPIMRRCVGEWTGEIPAAGNAGGANKGGGRIGDN